MSISLLLLLSTALSFVLLRVLLPGKTSLWLSLTLWLCLNSAAAVLSMKPGFNYQQIHQDGDTLGLAVLACVISLNIFCMPLLYGVDKLFARKQWQRVPETALHIPAFFGAAPGAFVGQQLFRHKTQKTAFRRVFYLSCASSCTVYYLLYKLL